MRGPLGGWRVRRTPNPNETLGEIRNRWALAVGRLILAFGDIEWVSLQCLHALPRDSVYGSLATLPLGRRIALLCEILGARPDLGEAAETLSDLFGRAEELSRVRNLVAHNPTAFGVYHDESTGRIHLVDEISSSKNPNRALTYEELSSAASEAESLASALSEAFYQIPGSLRRE